MRPKLKQGCLQQLAAADKQLSKTVGRKGRELVQAILNYFNPF